MSAWVRSSVLGLVAGLVLATTVVVGAAAPASAAGETLGCRVLPGPVASYSARCTNRQTADFYTVSFAVQNVSGSYTYSWSVTGNHLGVTGGCTSTSSVCGVQVANGAGPITGTVVLSQAGSVTTLRSFAMIVPLCGNGLCPAGT